MATKGDIKDALYAALKSIISDETDVTNPQDHVDVVDRHADAQYPFLGWNAWGEPVERGLDGSIHVDHLERDSNGDVQTIVYRRDYRLWVDIAAIVDDYDHATKTELLTAVQDHFSQYESYKNPEDFHSDVSSLADDGYNSYNGEMDAVVGDRLQYQFEYGRYTSYSDFQPLRVVKTDIETVDDPTYVYMEESVS